MPGGMKRKMTQMRRTATVPLVLLLLFAVVFFVSAQTNPPDSSSTRIELNERVEIALSKGEQRFTFSASSNSAYTFRSFGGEGVSAELYLGSQRQAVAGGDGFSFDARLISGKQYTLAVRGEAGTAELEIMRDALGRCIERPLEIRNLNEGYNKVIARAYDVHWYRFVPEETGLYMIATRSNLDTVGMLIDQDGQRIHDPDNAYAPYEGNFRLEAQLIRGRTYYLRVSAAQDSTGRYTLRFIRAGEDAPMPKSVTLNTDTLTLKDGEHAQLEFAIQPEGALSEVIWVSSDARVARVTESGVVTAVGAGQADIVALAFGGVSARCGVTVDRIAVESLSFDRHELELPVGEQLPLKYQLLPERASEQRVSFLSSDERVLSVDAQGNISGLAEGSATVTVTSQDGGHTDGLLVRVTPTPPKRRALVLGEQRYLDDSIRIGSVTTTQGMADLLRGQNFSGYGYEVTMKMDSTRGAVIGYVREAFKDAQPEDVSLFYINCHGGYENGEPYLKFFDGTRMSAQSLESELRHIPGTVVVIIDCCNSGGFIDKAQAETFSKRMISTFSEGQAGAFAMSKYRVLCSSSASQYSHRYSDTVQTEAQTSTVFARSLCEAGGWNLIRSRNMPIRADLDKDGEVTLEQAYQYTFKRVKQYLNFETAAEQDVQVYPKGSQFILFSK